MIAVERLHCRGAERCEWLESVAQVLRWGSTMDAKVLGLGYLHRHRRYVQSSPSRERDADIVYFICMGGVVPRS